MNDVPGVEKPLWYRILEGPVIYILASMTVLGGICLVCILLFFDNLFPTIKTQFVGDDKVFGHLVLEQGEQVFKSLANISHLPFTRVAKYLTMGGTLFAIFAIILFGHFVLWESYKYNRYYGRPKRFLPEYNNPKYLKKAQAWLGGYIFSWVVVVFLFLGILCL